MDNKKIYLTIDDANLLFSYLTSKPFIEVEHLVKILRDSENERQERIADTKNKLKKS